MESPLNALLVCIFSVIRLLIVWLILFCFVLICVNRIAIDVLRVAAKACVVKREFDKARILILKAVKMAG